MKEPLDVILLDKEKNKIYKRYQNLIKSNSDKNIENALISYLALSFFNSASSIELAEAAAAGENSISKRNDNELANDADFIDAMRQLLAVKFAFYEK